MKLIHAILVLLSTNLHSFGQAIKEIREKSIVLATKGCKTVVVDLRVGKISVVEGDGYFANCTLSTSTKLNCKFFDSKLSEFDQREFTGFISGNDLYFASEGDADIFLGNLTSQAFYAKSNLYLQNGLLRGEKICGGTFIFESQMENIIKDEVKSRKK